MSNTMALPAPPRSEPIVTPGGSTGGKRPSVPRTTMIKVIGHRTHTFRAHTPGRYLSFKQRRGYLKIFSGGRLVGLFAPGDWSYAAEAANTHTPTGT